jgi:hypothetical protein
MLPTPAEVTEPLEPLEPTAPREKRRPPRRGSRARRGSDAARDLMAAKALARAAEPAPVPSPGSEPLPDPGPASVVQRPPVRAPQLEQPQATAAVEVPSAKHRATGKPAASVSKHDEVAAEMPGVYRFKPKRSVRRVLTLALLAALVASAYFVRVAVGTQDTAGIGLAGIVVLATAGLWAIRAGASVTTLTVRQGQLEVVQQGDRFKLDLASQYTQVEVRGEPGKRGWKVVFARRGMEPFVVDASMVDPDDFMRVLRFFRPQLVHH